MAAMKGGEKRPAVERFLAAMPAELAALEKDVGELDRSYASLDRVEDYLLGVVSGKITGDKGVARGRVARYAGAVLAERAGGSWATRKKDEDAMCITAFPGYAQQECEPDAIARSIMKMGRVRLGCLREDIEVCDLPLRKQQLAALTRDPDARVRELRDDIEAITGKEPKLDFSPASVDVVEAAIQKMGDGDASREQRRRVRSATVVYLGAIAVRGLGRAEWKVKDKVGVVGFGHFSIHDWEPEENIRSVVPASRPGRLRGVVEYVLEGGE
jgi:hypothetical protein